MYLEDSNALNNIKNALKNANVRPRSVGFPKIQKIDDLSFLLLIIINIELFSRRH